MRRAQHVATIPIRADDTGRQFISAQPEQGDTHEEPELYPPRVHWTVTISDENKQRLIDIIDSGEGFLWWTVPDDENHRENIKQRIRDDDFEFRITVIERVPNADGEFCQHQPPYPFRQSLESKTRARSERWYRRIVFDPIPEAYPSAECVQEGCTRHEYKATAEVRFEGDDQFRHPGFEVDPHVIFHGDDDGDYPDV